MSAVNFRKPISEMPQGGEQEGGAFAAAASALEAASKELGKAEEEVTAAQGRKTAMGKKHPNQGGPSTAELKAADTALKAAKNAVKAAKKKVAKAKEEAAALQARSMGVGSLERRAVGGELTGVGLTGVVQPKVPASAPASAAGGEVEPNQPSGGTLLLP